MNVVRAIANGATKHAPTIFICLGTGGLITSIVFAVEATPKALKIIEEEEATEPLDIVKATWKCYIPTLIMAALSIACFCNSNRINIRRNAALASIYSLTEKTLKEYQEKVVEKFGEKKEQEVRDEIVHDTLMRIPVNGNEVIMTNRGSMLCLDVLSGRYFRSDIETIRRVQNDLNKMIIDEVWVSVNDYYSAIGLTETLLGDELGWNPDQLIELDFTSQIAENGEPCLVIKYIAMPRWDFRYTFH